LALDETTNELRLRIRLNCRNSDHVSKALAFGQMGGEYKDIITFGLYDGLM
jgi:hypothetical protein